jgi:hypothetical protein
MIADLPEPDLAVLRQFRRQPPAFPVDALGNQWGAWAVAAAEGGNAPVDYTAGGLLAVASALIGNARWASLYGGQWREPPALWIGCVGAPSANKSPGLDPALSLLTEVEADLAADHPDKMRDYETRKETARAAKEEWLGRVKGAVKKGETPTPQPDCSIEPEKPVRPRVRVSDVTPESLCENLSGNPKGLIHYRDELSGWLESFDRYAKGGDRALWTEAYGGRKYTVDRKGSGHLSIDHMLVAMLGTIQPDPLVALLLSSPDDGMAARFLWLWPDSLPPRPPRKMADRDRALAAVRRLASLQMGRDEKGLLHPGFVPFSDEAEAIFNEWRTEHYQGEQRASGLLASALGKMPGQAVRLALAFEHLWWSVTDAPDPREISALAVLHAVAAIGDYFKPMAERVYGDAAVAIADRKAATMARWIAREKPDAIDKRGMYRDVRLPGLTGAADVQAAIDVLMEAGWLLDHPARGRGEGVPPKVHPVNPRLWEVLT